MNDYAVDILNSEKMRLVREIGRVKKEKAVIEAIYDPKKHDIELFFLNEMIDVLSENLQCINCTIRLLTKGYCYRSWREVELAVIEKRKMKNYENIERK